MDVGVTAGGDVSDNIGAVTRQKLNLLSGYELQVYAALQDGHGDARDATTLAMALQDSRAENERARNRLHQFKAESAMQVGVLENAFRSLTDLAEILGVPDHVGKAAWEKARVAEPEGENHPCDHWNANRCMCKGSCSCHWEER
jgi:hypothetical protein